jgi:hypothetical protein
MSGIWASGRQPRIRYTQVFLGMRRGVNSFVKGQQLEFDFYRSILPKRATKFEIFKF